MIITSGIRISGGTSFSPEVVVAAGDTPANVTGATVVAQSPFASGNSYSFTGSTSSYVYYNGSSALAFGTGDFTIEWCKKIWEVVHTQEYFGMQLRLVPTHQV